jgi:hypothetical protein
MNGAWQKNLKISHKVTIESLFSRGVQSPDEKVIKYQFCFFCVN